MIRELDNLEKKLLASFAGGIEIKALATIWEIPEPELREILKGILSMLFSRLKLNEKIKSN